MSSAVVSALDSGSDGSLGHAVVHNYVKDFTGVQAYMFRFDHNMVAKNKTLVAGKGEVIIYP